MNENLIMIFKEVLKNQVSAYVQKNDIPLAHVCVVLNDLVDEYQEQIANDSIQVHQQNNPQIIDGEQCVKDDQGRWVATRHIEPIKLLRDDLVTNIAHKALTLQESIKSFKQMCFSEFDDYMGISAEKYNVKQRANINHATLHTFNGKYRLKISTHKIETYDERLIHAQELVEECVGEWATDANANLKVLVMDAFKVDSEGNMAYWRIKKLKKYKIDDARWHKAMSLIDDSLEVIESKRYVMLYERDDNGQYQPIPLNVAKV